MIRRYTIRGARGRSNRPTPGGSVVDHGNLSGLNSDDHPIYLRNDQDGEIEGGLILNDSLVLESDATVWDDLRFPATLQPKKGAPTETNYKGGQVLALSSSSDQGIYFLVQLPHSYKFGGGLEFHAHYALPTAGAGGGVENVKFDFTYSWADIEDAFPAESTLTATVDVQTFSADTHYLLDLSSLSGSSANVSSMIICSLTRDTSVANDYADEVYLLEADFHYEMDTLGSDEEYVK